MRTPSPRALRLAAALACLAPLLWAGLLLSEAWSRLGSPVNAHTTDFVGSDACVDCHSDRHQSWHSTFHRSMTQEARVGTVQGRFNGETLDYQGVRVRPVQEQGRHYFDYLDPKTGTAVQRYEVFRTVGSHRYQQYLTRLEDSTTYVRLHYLWHNEDQRWVHMNGAFLGRDQEPYDQHVAIWNQNCLFCHNTAPKPGMRNYAELQIRARRGEAVDSARESRFDSSVAELGIACESCHGPGATHVERAADFWSLVAMKIAPGRDTSIVNPVRLDAERATHVCAQCHAQRIPPSETVLHQWMHQGPSFRPGMDLHAHVTPVFRDTPVPITGLEDLFRQRFWADGTPRLSAYEYQALSQSSCYTEAELSCSDCHSMHSADPAGQLPQRNRGNTACLRCHEGLAGDAALAEHTLHAPESSGSECYGCHMPHLKYGVMEIHRSHRIEVPDARRDAEAARPNACLNCHQAESYDWVAQALAAWGDGKTPPTAVIRADGGPAGISDLATVLMGDPVQKAVVAWRAGRTDGAQRGRERGWMLPYLLAAMDDIYPASRRFAWRSLRQILDDWPAPGEVETLQAALASFDYMADERARAADLVAIHAAFAAVDTSHWPAPPLQSGVDADFKLPPELIGRLVELGRRADKQISIGE